MTNKNLTLGVIGGGNMGQAIIKGAIKSGFVEAGNIFVCEADELKADELKKACNVNICNAERAAKSSICVIAVKPDVAEKVLKSIAPSVADGIILSIVAGLSISKGEELLGGVAKFVRVMPNTPLMVGEGVTAVAFGHMVDIDDLEIVRGMFESLGRVFFIDEGKMDAVTGLSGSGPAYIFQIIEALSDGGVLEGLPRDKATLMAAQTVLGAAKMVIDLGIHPGVLKDMVTSPGGTTIEGILAMERGGVRKSMMEAVKASADKSRKMSGQ